MSKRPSWLARLWVASALLLIAGGAASVVYQLAVRLLHPSPVSGEILADLAEAARIEAPSGLLRDFNILLITMDTTRADHLHAYGNRAVETRSLDALARRGVLFAQAITPSPSTLPAHSSILTGLYPFHHGARANGTFKLSDGVQTLAGSLRAAGYQTGAVISAFVLDGRFGLPRGFDFYDDDLTKGVKYSPHMFRERPAELTNEAVFAWLERHAREGKFFLWAHYFDPHAAYLPPEPYRSRYADDLYTGEIAYTDRQIGKLLAKLKTLGVRDRTLVVVTSDHGEGRGEHGEMTHALLVYDATLHVPMIFSAPPPFPQGAAVRSQVSLIDVMPTILDLVGVEVPDGLDGRSLLGLGGDGPRPTYIENLSTQVLHGWAPLLGVRRDDYKFIFAPTPELYDLRGDPRELDNRYEQEPVLAADMHALLRSFVGDDPYMGTAAQQNLPLDPETEELLRSLGYVFTAGDKPPAPPDSYDLDPKVMVHHWEKVEQAVQRKIRGEIAQAIERLEQALEEVPDDVYARQVLSSAYQTYGEREKAYEMIRSVEERQPHDASSVAAVGSALLVLNRVAEAEEKFQRALELEPRSGTARLGLARIARRRHQEQEALALLREVIEIDPGSSGPAAHHAIGRLHLDKRELAEARQAFRQAIEIDGMYGPGYDGLAQVLLEEGKPDEALPLLATALRYHPAQPQTLSTLAQILRDQGELDQAIQLCERALEISPKFAVVYNNLGRIYRKRGDEEKAAEMYARAIEYGPRFDAPHVNRAQLLLGQGREEEAVEEFREAARLNPFNYIALANLGVRAYKEEDLPRARAFFQRALRVREDYALAHKYLGLIHAQQAQPRAAARHLERSLDLDDAQPEVEKMRFLLAEMRKLAEAP